MTAKRLPDERLAALKAWDSGHTEAEFRVLPLAATHRRELLSHIAALDEDAAAKDAEIAKLNERLAKLTAPRPDREELAKLVSDTCVKRHKRTRCWDSLDARERETIRIVVDTIASHVSASLQAEIDCLRQQLAESVERAESAENESTILAGQITDSKQSDPRQLSDDEVERLAEGVRKVWFGSESDLSWEEVGDETREDYRRSVRFLAAKLPAGTSQEVAELRAKVDELECTLDDEEAGHQETLRLWNEAKADRDQWKASFDKQASELRRLSNEREDFEDAIEHLRAAGKAVGCDHVQSPDERANTVRCIEQVVEGLEVQRDRAESDRDQWKQRAEAAGRKLGRQRKRGEWNRRILSRLLNDDSVEEANDSLAAELALYETAAGHLSAMADEKDAELAEAKQRIATLEAELGAVANLVQSRHHSREYRGIGLRECAEGLRQVYAEFDAELAEAKQQLEIAKQQIESEENAHMDAANMLTELIAEVLDDDHYEQQHGTRAAESESYRVARKQRAQLAALRERRERLVRAITDQPANGGASLLTWLKTNEGCEVLPEHVWAKSILAQIEPALDNEPPAAAALKPGPDEADRIRKACEPLVKLTQYDMAALERLHKRRDDEVYALIDGTAITYGDLRAAIAALKPEPASEAGIPPFPRDVSEWQKFVGEWSVATFPKATYQSHALHMLEEAKELVDAETMEKRADELADVVLLAFGCAHKAGIDLQAALECKHAICLLRKWGPPNENSVSYHIKEDEPEPASDPTAPDHSVDANKRVEHSRCPNCNGKVLCSLDGQWCPSLACGWTSWAAAPTWGEQIVNDSEFDVQGEAVKQEPARPTIVCLCGSGRFKDAFDDAEFLETAAGKIVLTIGCNTKDVARDADWSHLKPMLDELHKRKIDLCDEVLVLNVGGYIGESTRSEIEYAKLIGKPIRYLSIEQPDHISDVGKKVECKSPWDIKPILELLAKEPPSEWKELAGAVDACDRAISLLRQAIDCFCECREFSWAAAVRDAHQAVQESRQKGARKLIEHFEGNDHISDFGKKVEAEPLAFVCPRCGGEAGIESTVAEQSEWIMCFECHRRCTWADVRATREAANPLAARTLVVGAGEGEDA